MFCVSFQIALCAALTQLDTDFDGVREPSPFVVAWLSVVRSNTDQQNGCLGFDYILYFRIQDMQREAKHEEKGTF